eukprot:scpid95460/ scgid16422/ 
MEPSEDNINNAPVSKSAEWEDKTQSSDGSATFTSPGKPSDGAGCLTTSANPDTENQQQSVVVDDSEENSTDRNRDEELSPTTACAVGSGPTTRAAGAMPVVSIQIIPSSPIGDEAPVVSQPVNSEDSRASSMSPEAVAALSDTSSNTEVTGVRDGTQAEDTSPRPRDNLVQEDGLPLDSTETADQETNVSSASSSQSRTTRRRFEDPRQVTMLYMNQHNVDGVLKVGPPAVLPTKST